MEKQKEHYQTQRIDHLGIVAGICKQIKLIETIDNYLPTESGRKVSCGQATQAMVLNALGLTGRALYLMPEYLKNKPIDLLIGEGLEAEDFNDDSLGRALDELQQAGITELFASIVAQAVAIFELESDYAHVDTSSLSLTGQYDSDYAQAMSQRYEAVTVRHGYSKEQRPDLKQVVVSLITSQASAIPLWLEVLDGNSSDKTSLRATVLAYCEQLEAGQEPPCFVMDSAAYSHENLQAWQGLRWITRVPESIAEVKALKQSIATDEMTELADSRYRVYPVIRHYAEVEQRWLLVYSEQAFKREHKRFVKQLQKEQQEAEAALKKLGRQSFNCQADARAAAEALAQELNWHSLDVALLPLKKYSQAGRPAKGAVPKQQGWHVSGNLTRDEARIASKVDYLGRFVLASNELDESRLSDEDLLSQYKAQSSSVERSFRFLKDPMFFADSPSSLS